MRPFCNTCGTEQPEGTGREWWDNDYTCKKCGEGYDEFEKWLKEDGVEFNVPKAPKEGDVIEIKIKPA